MTPSAPVMADGRVNFDETPLAWVPWALRNEGPDSSPVKVFNMMSEHALDLTPGLIEVSRRGFAGRVFSPLAPRIDKDTASLILHEVSETIGVRAKRRKLAADMLRYAAEEEEAALERANHMRAAQRHAQRMQLRARVAGRKVRTTRWVDNGGRLHWV